MNLSTSFQTIRASMRGTLYLILVLGRLISMDKFEWDPNSRKNLAFLNSHMSTKDVMFISVSFPSSTEKTLTASSPLRNSCTDIPHKKNDIIEYPGRSVLYSRKFLPLNRIINTDFKTPQSEPEPSGNNRADEDKGNEE